ncbi:PLP-dependent aminotransferase family protein [Microbacterium sp. SSW1-59]|uniref:MocR-like transcription factor YczR n=1 Tax=Microbacterium xanthum TaxID=3079794 RepID=UPI002AD487B5|nr:PLP-dependent aminotransferase family protein [Microbacterium sp. SSW1-59]MDZ8201910.1 PLP-dependent aminotransferase family protein [Microbacterium sp. SSW1-59]
MDAKISARALTAAIGGWRSRDPAYEALADAVRLLCMDNRIAPRTVLPAERELAQALGVSRSTVAAAYRSLRESGHIASVRGSGSVTLPLMRDDPGLTSAAEGAIDLQQASPPAWPGLAGVIGEAVTGAAAIVRRSGYDMVGDARLRRGIAERYAARGLPTHPDQILITNGAQSAIHLLARTLVSRGDRVLLETPTYPHAADAFRRAGARLVGVPVTTGEGWDLDRAVQAFGRTMPNLAYLMPDYQNPTGRSMSDGERATFLREAERVGTTLIVDETTADLGIDTLTGERSFRAADPAHVVRIGSVGKTVWGGLRVGWIRGEVALLRRLVAARPVGDLGTPELEQDIARRLVTRMDEIVAQRAHVLGVGRDALVETLREELPEWAVPSVHGGVSLWVELDAPLSSALVLDVRARGLLLSAGPRFSVDGGHDRHLRIPFTASPDTLRRAARILADRWPDVRRSAPHVGAAALAPVV